MLGRWRPGARVKRKRPPCAASRPAVRTAVATSSAWKERIPTSSGSCDAQGQWNRGGWGTTSRQRRGKRVMEGPRQATLRGRACEAHRPVNRVVERLRARTREERASTQSLQLCFRRCRNKGNEERLPARLLRHGERALMLSVMPPPFAARTSSRSFLKAPCTSASNSSIGNESLPVFFSATID